MYSGVKVGRRRRGDTPGVGVPVHTSDVLDFAGIHLSSFERYYHHLMKDKDKRSRKIEQIQALLKPSVERLQLLHASGMADMPFKNTYGEETLVVIPYFAQKQWRTAESILQNRPLYLNATYYSLISHFSKFVVAVQNREDKNFIEKESGLLLHAILQLKINAKGFTKLPVAALHEVTKLTMTGSKIMRNIKYVFYCEADMMYTMRRMSTLMRSMQNNEFVLFPHRLMTYLPGHLDYMKKGIETNVIETNDSDLDPYFLMENGTFISIDDKIQKMRSRKGSKYSCCSDLLNCTTRSHWQELNSDVVSVHRLFGLPVVVATSHDPFEGGKFRVCNITESKQCQGVHI